MYLFQCFQNSLRNFHRFFNGYSAALLLDVFLVIHTIQKFHDDVCRIIFFKEVIHVNDIGMCIEFRHISGFFQKTHHTVGTFLSPAAGIDDHLFFSRHTVDQSRRIIFLNSYYFSKHSIPCLVSNAESAAADGNTYDVPVCNHCSGM